MRLVLVVAADSVTSFAASAVTVRLVSIGGIGCGPLLLLLLLLLLELEFVFVAGLLVAAQGLGAYAEDSSGAAELNRASEDGHV
jgi:hypothetical protein